MRAAAEINPESLTDEIKKRFWSKVMKTDGCWRWTGAKTVGYGRFKMFGAVYGAHRVSVVIHRGADIPAGLVVDHLCRQRDCVRPEHLDLVTLGENTLRGESPSAIAWRIHREGECSQGHDLAEHGVRRKCGRIVCRECRRQYMARSDVRERTRDRARRARAEGRWASRS